MSDYSTKLNDLLKNKELNEMDMAFLAYNIILSAGNRAPSVLKKFLHDATVEPTNNNKKPTETTEAIIKKTLARIADPVDEWIDSNTKGNCKELDFYKKLWSYLQNDQIFETISDRAIALYWIWMDPRIPYYQLEPGITMESSEFTKLATQIQPLLSKARFAVFSTYEQRVEESSVLLKIMSQLNDEKEKAIFLAYVIRSVELRTAEVLAAKDKKKESDT